MGSCILIEAWVCFGQLWSQFDKELPDNLKHNVFGGDCPC